MIANAGIGLVGLLATLVGILPCMLLIAVGGPIAAVGIGLGVAWVIAVQLVVATLTGIFQIALYRFATDGTAPGFDNDKLREAFRPRGGRSTFGGFGGFGGNRGFGGNGFGGPAAPGPE
jgi:hypothetical protein